MALTLPIKLTQTTAGVALFSVGACFAGGYYVGKHVGRAEMQPRLDQLAEQLSNTSDENMRIWRKHYSEPFRNPPAFSDPPDGE